MAGYLEKSVCGSCSLGTGRIPLKRMEIDQHLTSTSLPHVSMARAKCFRTWMIRLDGSQLPSSGMEANAAHLPLMLYVLLEHKCASEFLRSVYTGPVSGRPGPENELESKVCVYQENHRLSGRPTTYASNTVLISLLQNSLLFNLFTS